MVNDADRVYFLLDSLPNNRLTTTDFAKQPHLQLRRLGEGDHTTAPVVCGVESMDRVTWSDRWFDTVAGDQGRCTYLLEAGDGIAGYLTIHHSGDGCLIVDEVAIAKKHKGKKWGAVLMRFADTLARQCNCRRIELNAIECKASWYNGFEYVQKPGASPILLTGEKYIPMEKPILHHLPRHASR